NKEFADGVNLGLLTDGPVHEQGQKVFNLINAKNEIVHQRFRGVVVVNLNFPDWAGDLGKEFGTRKADELTKRMKTIDERQAEVYAAVKPVKHTFKLETARGE